MSDESPTPEDQETTETLRDSTSTSRRIGNYCLLQKLGEGGMGEVWEAEQESPIRRRVALKLIKWGMDTRSVIARFEAERQALALMNHPNVARVFDAGATTTGRPYFVMELVRGTPITTHCDRNRLTTIERLELFRRACAGVQHAHRNGIIHRDIKPSNVLVQVEEDGSRTPKIIDFGVAKATQQRLTERTLFTELGTLIGTPEYMSPEQAEMTAEEIDARTDVYSLGVLLYELLVGALPFDPSELRRAAFDEIRRKIRVEEPLKPSTRVSTLGNSAEESARNRRTNPSSLRRHLRGDLDWITLKALDKDRARRYGSPIELAEDIHRHLKDEPVQARPPSATYRLSRFVGRNRIALGGLALVAVILALVATLVQESVVGRSPVQFPLEARLREVVDPNVINLNVGREDGVKDDMEVEIVRRGTGVSVATGSVVGTSTSSSRVRIDSGAGTIDPQSDIVGIVQMPGPQVALARGLRDFEEARYDEAIRSFDGGLEIDPRDSALHAAKARAHQVLGQHPEALASFARALAFGSGNEDLLVESTRARFEAGRLEEIIATLSKEDVARLDGRLGTYLGMAYELIGRSITAKDTYHTVVRAHPGLPEVHLRLAIQALGDADFETARRELRLATELGPEFTEAHVAAAALAGDRTVVDKPELLQGFASLATAAEVLLVSDFERWSEAVILARRSITMNPRYVRARLLEARALSAGSRWNEAIDRLEEAREVLPDSFAVVWLAAKLLSADDTRMSEALDWLSRARELAPRDRRPLELTATLYSREGQYLAAANEYRLVVRLAADAEEEDAYLFYTLGRMESLASRHTRAIDPLERCVQLAPDFAECRYDLAVSQFETGRETEALEHFLAAVGISERYYYIARIHEKRGDRAAANEALTHCRETQNTFADDCEALMLRLAR